MNSYTETDMVNAPWCYMPPEMHFESPKDLKDAFWAFALSRVQDNLNESLHGLYFLPPVNKFERVRNNHGKYILIPTSIDQSFVFRGQTDFYKECKPTLYRKRKTEEEILLERLRCCEFEVYLKQFPQVEAFERENFNIDYLGLSQHYGLMTDVIDLTNSLDVALFFAMCNMSKDGKSFSPQVEDKEYIGYIYAVGTMEFGNGAPNNIVNLFDGKLSAIGMQPFYRPGKQRGFGLHLDKDETLTGLLYSFSYTKTDSELVYKAFADGETLWHEDEISRVAREIKNTKTFSYKGMNQCFKRYYKKSSAQRKDMKQKLNDIGCVFQKLSLWEIDKETLRRLKDEFEATGGIEGMDLIVQRKIMDNGKIKQCADMKMLSRIQHVIFPESGCKAPDGYESPYNYMKSNDGKVWGFSQKKLKQEDQTLPNLSTHKVEKWKGDWRTLKIDYHKEKKLKMETVIVPKNK